jgi:hypothetical protein
VRVARPADSQTLTLCYRGGVKTLPPPAVPGNTDAERMDNAVRRTFTVSKAEVLKREAEWQRANGRKKRAKRNGA